jgi:hypothetical protein
MVQPIQSYIRLQGATCAVINAVLNPAIAWLGNRRMVFVPLSGDNSILVDTAVTCIVMSLLVSLFVTPATERELRAGKIEVADSVIREARVLAHFPSRAWSLGLAAGIVAAVVITPLMFAALRALGLSGLAFVEFALLKVVYTAVLGYAVTRWVILRQVLKYRENAKQAG